MLSRILAISLSMVMFLSGCVATTGSVKNSESIVGPSYSSEHLKPDSSEEEVIAIPTAGPKLDIIVPVFDPGLPEDLDGAEDDGIWPELRRAEANLFAYKLKNALENTGRFGAVRVTPDKTSTGDLYVLGRIEESNGEKVGIKIEVYDISERKWLKKAFRHTVEDRFYSNSRNSGKDPYEPVFVQAADYIVEQLQDYSDKQLEGLQTLTEIRFGASFSDDKFAPYLKYGGNSGFSFFSSQSKVSLAGLPSDDDPMMHRVRSLRIRDQLFIDRMQSHYEIFSQNMSSSYYIWQESSSLERKAIGEARNKAIVQAVVGVLLIAGAAYASSNNDNNNVATTAVAVTAGIGGAMMLSESVQTVKEANFHKDTLAELGQSLNLELEPQVVEFEKSTTKLTGDASEQFNQWRTFLKQIYLAESVPDVQL